MPVLPVQTQGLTRRDIFFLEENPAGFGQYAGAAGAQQLFDNLMSAAAKAGEFQRAGGEFVVGGEQGEIDPLQVMPGLPPLSPHVPAEEARRRFKEVGVDVDVPDAGYTQAQIDLLIEWQLDEQRRQSVLARPPSAGAVAAGFGVGLAASLLDPLNVASGFVPVVGPARYASWVARAGSAGGRLGVRAGVGAVEGAVGAALLEPVIHASLTSIQADYDLQDSLLNIAFGTLMGAGMHAGAGAIADALARGVDPRMAMPQEGIPQAIANLPAAQREATARVAVGQAFSGRTVDVGPLHTPFPEPGTAAAGPLDPVTARRQAFDEVRAAVQAEFEGRVPEGALTDKQARAVLAEKTWLEQQLDALDATFGERAKRIQRTEKRASRKQAERAARKEIEAERTRLETEIRTADEALRTREAARAARGDLDRLARGEAPAELEARIEARAAQIIGEAQLRGSVRNAMNDWRASAEAAAARTNAPEAVAVADPKADAAITERVEARSKDDAADVDTDLADANLRVKELQDQLELEAADPDMTAAADVIDQTKAMGRAMRAAAVCMLSKAA